MTFTNFPTNPVYPMITWKRADTAIAPESSLIRTNQSSSLTSADIEENSDSLGHCHCGSAKIASVGTKNEMVPPWNPIRY